MSCLLAIACQGGGGGGGSSTAGTATPDPNPLDFGTELVGSQMAGNVAYKARGDVDFIGPGATMGGPNRTNFKAAMNPDGALKDGNTFTIQFIFSPDKVGAFEATYKPGVLRGTAVELALKGKGAWSMQVGHLSHSGALPDGHDFGEVCIGQSSTWTFTTINGSPNDEWLAMFWNPSHPSFALAAGTQQAQMATKNGGKASWPIVFKPAAPPAEASAGILVRIPLKHEHRTGTVVKGKGKLC
jgi:hypothetical protein